MATASDKPLAERLRVTGARRLAVSEAPAAIDAAIDAPRADPATADVVLRFIRQSHDQPRAFAFLKAARADALLWLGYPERRSPLAGDIGRDTIRSAARVNGLDTVAQVAINGDWSALRLTRSNAAGS